MAKKGKWSRDIDRGVKNFAKQEGRQFSFMIIPVSCWDDMMKAAKRGDQEARSAFIAFVNWSTSMEKGIAEGVRPLCVSCFKEIHSLRDGGEGIGGWAQILPTKEAGIGMVTPICVECIGRDYEYLSKKVLDALEDDVGVRAMRVQ